MVLEKITTSVQEKEFVVPASSGALVKCENQLVLMRRDDTSTIPDPGKLAILGGGIKKGETVRGALKRELGEEIGISVLNNQIRYLGVLKAANDTHTKNISLVEITPEQRNRIKKGDEGQSIDFFSPNNLPPENELVPDLKGIFVNNKSGLIKWLNGEDVTETDLGLTKEMTD